jgi:hypothetical protein
LGSGFLCHFFGKFGHGLRNPELASVGAASPITINIMVPTQAGEMTNQALVSSVTAESGTSNNSVSEVTTVNAVAVDEQADLSLSLAESLTWPYQRPDSKLGRTNPRFVQKRVKTI